MEKFSRWRDPSTGIQPYLPIAQPQGPPAIRFLLFPLTLTLAVVRVVLLAVVLLAHVVVVEGACLILAPIPPTHRLLSGLLTALTCRSALAIMGYYWITTELVSSKKTNKNVSQIADRPPRRGDLIITNYTSYIDILYLAFRYNPTFLLPVFAPLDTSASSLETTRTGRHTGTGSANISTAATPQPDFLGYLPVPLLALLGRTGSLPPTVEVIPKEAYKTLRAARRAERRPVVLLAEGTTSNGRAILKLPEGVLEEGDIGNNDEGIVWLKFFRHSPPSSNASSATSPLPLKFSHLFGLLATPSPLPSRTLHVRTQNPSHSPSSPSFLPSEILSATPGGYDGVGKDGTGAWREAIAVTLAELGRVRRVRGMGWVEKSAFLDFYAKRSRR